MARAISLGSQDVATGADTPELGMRFLFEVRGVPPLTRGTGPTNRVSSIRPQDLDFGRFSKITGLREEIETVAWRDGRDPLRVRKGIGSLGGGTVTFEKGVMPEPLGIITWFNNVRRAAKRLEAAASTTVDDRRETPKLDLDRVIGTVLSQSPQSSGSIVRGRTFGRALPSAEQLEHLVYHDLLIVIGRCAPFEKANEELIFGTAPSVRTIRLTKCVPIAYQLADLDAQASEVSVESLSVAFDQLIPEEVETQRL